MAGEVTFNNGLTKGAGDNLLNGLLADIYIQDNVSYAYKSGVKDMLHYKSHIPTNPEQVFSEQVGAEELDEITENQNVPVSTVSKGADKGFAVKVYAKKLPISKLFMKWLEKNQTIDTADSAIQALYAQYANATINLKKGGIKQQNNECVKVFTEGFVSTAANGAGSPTAYGQALFSGVHSIKGGAETFSNLLSTPNGALTAVTLQDALTLHKTAIKLQNGDFTDNNSTFELRVPRALEQTAREILQDSGKGRYQFAGTGNNSALLNTFDFDGNMVELKVIPTVGNTDKNGVAIGAGTYRWVANPIVIDEFASLKYIELWASNIESRYNHDNKQHYASIDMSFGVDHFGGQYGIIGSKGTV